MTERLWPSSWALGQPNPPRSRNRARAKGGGHHKGLGRAAATPLLELVVKSPPAAFVAPDSVQIVAGRPGSYSDTSWRSKAPLRAGNARRGAATNPTTDA